MGRLAQPLKVPRTLSCGKELANPEASQLATAVALTAWVLALMRIWYAVLALTP